MDHQEVKRHKDYIDLLRVKAEACLKEFGKYIDVDVTLVDLLLRDQASYERLRQSQRRMLSCQQVSSLEDLSFILGDNFTQSLKCLADLLTERLVDDICMRD